MAAISTNSDDGDSTVTTYGATEAQRSIVRLASARVHRRLTAGQRRAIASAFEASPAR